MSRPRRSRWVPYGWYFEDRADIINHPLIPFYGRYIDDCFAIVYANSEEEALQHMSVIQFDECIIEWNVSDQHQVFLDMTLYVDENRRLQHMPYRKIQSHQERIPWNSAHPLDVKRGTFVGEMSRLATLSSLNSHYCDAIRGLVALYVKRGYPQNVVAFWAKNNILERWNKRLNETVAAREDILVLKSEYNTAWNYFSATELGNTILGFWRDYLNRAETGGLRSIQFPEHTKDLVGLHEYDVGAFGTDVQVVGGRAMMPDVRKIGFSNRRTMVSKKRTRNLFDLTNLWKNIVLTKMEHKALSNETKSKEQNNSDDEHDADINIVLHRSLDYVEGDNEDSRNMHRAMGFD